MELWKKIEGFEGYEISNLGKIKSLERKDIRGCVIEERILKPSSNNMGHLIVTLRKNGKGHTKQVSRLVAKAFPEICGEMFEGCHIHHIDHNPLNNSAENLTVVTPKHHRETHKKESKLGAREKPVYKYDLEWNFIKQYDSAKQAALEIKGDYYALQQAINSETHYYKGYKWLYA